MTERLARLGCSTREGRTSVGRPGTGTATGDAVANLAGVPPHTVYGTLRRLESRGAVVRMAGSLTRWSTLPTDTLPTDTLPEKLHQGFGGRAVRARSAPVTPQAGTGAEPRSA